MGYTLGQLKAEVRSLVFPAGEAVSLVAAHDKFILDALIDLQTWIDCFKQNNTDIRPQCATIYRCGITVLDAPRGHIKKLSVIDKIDPLTGLESATANDDWCSEITYCQINPCHIQNYWKGSNRCGCCLPFSYLGVFKPFPTPTDVGLPSGLASLPLGYSYPQTSTDRTLGRAGHGVWAIESGQIFVAPWIQSSESVILKWDGIKRTWADADPLEQDPLLSKAVEEYLRWQHAAKFDRDELEAVRAEKAFFDARAMMIHECREETRQRDCCEPSFARSAPNSLTDLFYNEEQSASADCPAGTTGAGSTYTIPAGTIASTISVADANQKAKDEAQKQAQSRLDCQPQAITYSNTPQTATVYCQGAAGAPTPDGSPVTVTVAAGIITSTVSQSDADQQALALAQAQASSQLICTFWNAEQSVTLICDSDAGITVTKTVAAHSYSSSESQAVADAQAKQDAQNQAAAALALVCSTQPTVFWNTQQLVRYGPEVCYCTSIPHNIGIICVVPAHTVSGQTQLLANQQAQNLGQQKAFSAWELACHQCRPSGTYQVGFP